MDARSLVFDVQDPIFGWGRLVRTSDGDWFDPPLAVALVGSWGRRVPAPSSYATPVEGATFDTVENRVEHDGAVEGHAMIFGRWLGDRIIVDRQTTERREPRIPRWSDPPCPSPPGGWPRGFTERSPGNLYFDLGDLEETGAAVTVVIFRPSDDQALLVIAATDIPAVEAQLRPQLPDRLCVVASRWTRGQLDGAHEYLGSLWERWGIYETGQACDEQAQATITAKLVRVTDEIAGWVEAQPDGLVTLEPCLAPASIRPAKIGS